MSVRPEKELGRRGRAVVLCAAEPAQTLPSCSSVYRTAGFAGALCRQPFGFSGIFASRLSGSVEGSGLRVGAVLPFVREAGFQRRTAGPIRERAASKGPPTEADFA